jgi:phosphoribosyl-ATP pyrophosphohydrolase
MILRLSQKLNKKIKAGTLSEKPLDDDPYADWSCHLFTADRMQYVIVTNTKSLYSTVMYGKGITDDSRFIDRVVSSLREFTESDGQAFVYQKFIAPSSATVSFAKALNRSVTGSMNDMIYHAQLWLIKEELSPFDVGFKLNEMPMSALGYANPKDAFKKLAET